MISLEAVRSNIYGYFDFMASFSLFLVLIPIKTAEFLVWLPAYLTDNYDPSMIFLECFILTCFMFEIVYLYKATNHLQLAYSVVSNLISYILYFFLLFFNFCLENYIYIAITIILCGLLSCRLDKKLHKLFTDTKVSESDDRAGWTRDPCSKNDPNFVAPSTCVKIRGLVENLTSKPIPEICNESIQVLHDRLAPNSEWSSFSLEPTTMAIFVLFNNREQATRAFLRLNGYFYDEL